eukprot:GHVR01092640.1.p1 GENE.GHVR01092640.1~~GHVR01092640.1.p1  ORF type:complete len:210 (+),score=60.12 GHVR01092640.1:131-760(+)
MHPEEDISLTASSHNWPGLMGLDANPFWPPVGEFGPSERPLAIIQDANGIHPLMNEDAYASSECSTPHSELNFGIDMELIAQASYTLRRKNPERQSPSGGPCGWPHHAPPDDSDLSPRLSPKKNNLNDRLNVHHRHIILSSDIHHRKLGIPTHQPISCYYQNNNNIYDKIPHTVRPLSPEVPVVFPRHTHTHTHTSRGIVICATHSDKN